MKSLIASAKAAIAEILPPEEILEPSSGLYEKESKTWAYQRQQHPALVVRPASAAKLQKLVPYLYASDLDFAIRCGGIGSSSAKHVVVSMKAFDAVAFNPDDQTVTVGAGLTWGEVEQKLEELAPGRVVVATRVSWVGVAGSILSGGLSWIGTEFGLAADPHNLLDVEMVLRDGRKVWASSEPELLWALRGGGGNFGVATAFRMRTYPYTSSIFAGPIAYPPSALEAVSRRVSEYTRRPFDPKLSVHCLIGAADEGAGQSTWVAESERPGGAESEGAAEFKLCVFVFDAHGEEHGRSAEGFQWALDVPGAVDMTTVTNLRGVNDLQGECTEHLFGATNSYLNACLADEIDPDFVIRGKEWVDKVVAMDKRLGPGTLFLLEIMHGKTFSSTNSPDETAWPHSSAGHVLQLLTGSMPDSGCPEELALEALRRAPFDIKKAHSPADFFPNFIESINDCGAIFGVNYDRLRQIKKRYDPDARFNKGCFIPPP